MYLQSRGGSSGNLIESLPRIPVIAFDQPPGYHRIWMFILSHLIALPAFLISDG
ncbi:hypothetical protein ACZ87_01786 [Candidatus Erwinia dacicola]|uniref:Uncharacterized protein n=1 Tax=Candidatus Erwinia dacicola TaxID=252393 RepID=A0A328TQP7_9GAMM|nr:hypothetical protein ACZ87_01786 [Candidatus Erwinia dacicola]